MKRRTLLVTLGAAATAGCAGIAPPEGRPAEPTTGRGPRTPASEMDDCQSFAPDSDRTVCWPTEDRLESRVYLNASVPTFEPDTDNLAAETLEFVLHDQHPNLPVEVNTGDWHIHRRTVEGWTPVASGTPADSSRTIQPGERHTWSLSFQPHPTPQTRETTYIVEPLENGTYAFQTVARLVGEAGDTLRVECIAVVDVRRQ